MSNNWLPTPDVFVDRLKTAAEIESAWEDWLKERGLDSESISNAINNFHGDQLDEVKTAALDILDDEKYDLSQQIVDLLGEVLDTCEALLG